MGPSLAPTPFGRAALQYSNTPGFPELLSRLKNIQRFVHSPPGRAADFDLAVTNGSQVRSGGKKT
jgi:hypothetical protein